MVMATTIVPNKKKSNREFCTVVKKRVDLMNAKGLIVMNVKYIGNGMERMHYKGALITYKRKRGNCDGNKRISN